MVYFVAAVELQQSPIIGCSVNKSVRIYVICCRFLDRWSHKTSYLNMSPGPLLKNHNFLTFYGQTSISSVHTINYSP